MYKKKRKRRRRDGKKKKTLKVRDSELGCKKAARGLKRRGGGGCSKQACVHRLRLMHCDSHLEGFHFP